VGVALIFLFVVLFLSIFIAEIKIIIKK